MSEEHPVQQPIRMIEIEPGECAYIIGRNGITRIEACIKPGVYSNLPYVRIWRGDECEAEFCQHHIVGVYFGLPE